MSAPAQFQLKCLDNNTVGGQCQQLAVLDYSVAAPSKCYSNYASGGKPGENAARFHIAPDDRQRALVDGERHFISECDQYPTGEGSRPTIETVTGKGGRKQLAVKNIVAGQVDMAFYDCGVVDPLQQTGEMTCTKTSNIVDGHRCSADAPCSGTVFMKGSGGTFDDGCVSTSTPSVVQSCNKGTITCYQGKCPSQQ